MMKKMLRSAVAILCTLAALSAAAATNTPPHVARAFARCKTIRRDIERIRGLPFKKPVKMDVQSPDSLRKKIGAELARHFGEEGPDHYIDALVTLGLLDRPVDLEETLASLLEGQAAAHYDVDSETYYLLMTNQPAQMLDAVSAHELCHALQDQHFDLDKFMPRDAADVRGRNDWIAARQCLGEGEATYVMYVWTLMKSAAISDPESVDWMVGMAITMQKSLELSDMMALASAGGGMPGGEQSQAAFAALTNTPEYFVETMLSPYFDGSAMIKHVKDKGGWDAVTALYTHPPESTEQVLHPEKLTGAVKDPPVQVALPGLARKLSDSWRLVEQDVMGELGVRTFLRIWRDRKVKSDATAVSAAEGWGGDRYYYFVDAEKEENLLVWKTVWDSSAEAAEFLVAYRLALDRRFPGMKRIGRSGKDSDYKYWVWEVEPGRFLKLTRKDKMVGIIDTTIRKLTGLVWE